ncbi:hypothetical protein [Streptomyces xanthochromogenes]|uniref:hypothetical protein n=1 Tax=Streptomyces xanthochromogenes TaxID=67384 RepID=UPI00342A5B26
MSVCPKNTADGSGMRVTALVGTPSKETPSATTPGGFSLPVGDEPIARLEVTFVCEPFS